ncbi:MAG: LptE family protein [Elusimicrobia bacterium]|nr:LptE family protein [Elusimicrobiota bacterium]
MRQVQSSEFRVQSSKWFYLLPFTFYLLPAFIGCSSAPYTPAPQVLPQNIRKVAIETFKNSTVYYGMEEKLTLAATNEFIRDGRLEVVNPQEADGILRGEITRYVLEPLTYDENHVVKEYKLWILVDIMLVDRLKNEVVWQEKNLEGNYRFFVSNIPGGITEEEAREIIWEKLARAILKRTIEGFGAVTGISEKKVPPKTE